MQDHDKQLRQAMSFMKSGKPMPDSAAVGEEVLVADDVPVAAPEHSAPGESASNGLAERAVQSIEGQVRRHNLDATWRYGIFLGRSFASDRNNIGLRGGTITRARGIARPTPERRWQHERIMHLASTPINEHTQILASIEEEPDPHAPPV